MVPWPAARVKSPIYVSDDMEHDKRCNLEQPWHIGSVEIAARIALAPMAGVSIQAYRCQGKRFGAALVCSEMISAAGLHYGSAATRRYLEIAPGEHPIAIQIFGSDPALMAEAARMAADRGADLIDLNLGCPVKKVVSTGAGVALMSQPLLACRVVEAMTRAVSVPITVKMRRGLEPESRTCIELAPMLVAAGASAIVLHPRSQRQMYGGSADHSLTLELAATLAVPVIASGDVSSHERACELVSDGVAAVMVGRAAQGNPWLLKEIMTGEKCLPEQAEVVAELIRFMRETALELGERRASGFLKKFYGWYLRRGRFPREMRRELVETATLAAAEKLLLSRAPGARMILNETAQTASDVSPGR